MARRSKGGSGSRNAAGKSSSEPTFHCKRMVTFAITRPVSDSGTTRTVNLNVLPGASEFTGLFQHYRIKRVYCDWILVNGLNANNRFPTLTVAPQHHNALITATRDVVSQYNGAKVFQFAPSRNQYSRWFDAYGPLLTVSSGQKYVKGEWYRCEDSTIPYVFAVEFITGYNSTDTPNHLLELTLTAEVEFRGTK